MSKNLLIAIMLLVFYACTSNNKSPDPVVQSEPSIPTVSQTPPEKEEGISDAIEKAEETDYEVVENLTPTYTQRGIAETLEWKTLEEGLDYLSVQAPLQCNIGPSTFDILRIDLNFFELDLISAGALKTYSSTAPQYAAQFHLLAAFNAGMYQMDGKTSTGFLKDSAYVNNGHFNSKYKTIFAFNPKSPDAPASRLIDLECDDWDHWKTVYHSYTQCIRMVSCKQKNVWSQQNKRWSMIAVGSDTEGRILFTFTRSPYSVHDFINQLKQLPIDLQQAMYLEGGPEASFYVDAGGTKVAKMGSYETGFWENDGNHSFWEVPNIIGVKRKK